MLTRDGYKIIDYQSNPLQDYVTYLLFTNYPVIFHRNISGSQWRFNEYVKAFNKRLVLFYTFNNCTPLIDRKPFYRQYYLTRHTRRKRENKWWITQRRCAEIILHFAINNL